MPQLSFRYATVDDVEALAALASKAFEDTYRGLEEPHEIANYVEEHLNAGAIQSVVLDQNVATLLAEAGPTLAGYAMITQSEPPACVSGPVPIELWRFYLAEQFIGKGNGAQLMLAVDREARRKAAQTIWLSVLDRNLRAVTFYTRFGFSRVGGREFLFGGRISIDPVYAAAVRGDA